MTALQVNNLRKSFGGLDVIQDVSFTVEPGERRLLLGPNGAGKTTLFNLIAGDLRASGGRILLQGRDVSALSTSQRAACGLGRTFQILTLFGRETVLGNVVMALLGSSPKRWKPFGAVVHDTALRRRALSVLARVKLEGLADRPIQETSYGEKRRLEIAMALAQDPQVLLLDEPLAGLSKEERGTVSALLEDLPRSLTIVMIEHDMDVALAFAERIALLNHGRLLVDGTRDEVIADPRTREAYLAQ
ncbi:ABC transporter ATP-binding protein [Chelatococcus asaccharovorans]|uniref:Amino acid/amide ABC transporter ATP-binding protein 1 (HAAT family) n=1 Tax=Chelatococcus asaccharovorans TaxID=28210 RepID=A0A2V3UVG3_9HYPH|nr:ABC transporter ATP-binding protein [Chelatococcus asaccharovorans]MBS7706632.1 ABC transporter ATP-binding protein [Chelatococcus asaccharovorans]PXW64718.1 amino acid/amide ABC transporter ATP-binding protein 1 (HAAT family) [Chelatococcus asaccharovorans]